MPYFSIETNQRINDGKAFTDSATSFIAGLLNKPEKFIMVSLKGKNEMRFAGTTDLTAFIQLKSIGLPDDKDGLIESVFEFAEKALNTPKNRIYLELTDIKRELFAYNGKSFKR
ncbi:MAG: phenylpyruvate tautomerase MIF-related protein [Bacteroidales bacterium]